MAAGLFLGAQITSHEERALNYNLEDVELDEIHKLEAEARAKGKQALASALGKLKAAAAALKQREEAANKALFGKDSKRV